MIDVDMRDIQRLERELKSLNKLGVPFAAREALNKAAFDAQGIARRQMERELTLRNMWTQRAVQVDKARSLNLSHQRAYIGTVASYGDDMELGGTKKPAAGAKHVSIPANAARIGKSNARMVRKGAKMSAIQLRHRPNHGKNRRERNAITVYQAKYYHDKHVMLYGNIYAVKKAGRTVRLERLWDVSRVSVPVHKRPIITPSALKAAKGMRNAYHLALQRQIERLR